MKKEIHSKLSRFQIKSPMAVFAVLFFINLFNYIDRQVLYAVFPLIQTDLGLSDTKLGLLASSFMVVYMLFSPIAGYFGDRGKRQHWIGAAAVLWSVATFSAAFSKTYAHLFAARAAVGIGEGGFTTQSPSLISEYFSKEKRAAVLSFFGVALPVGAALGYLLGGYFGEHYGWRAAFIILAVPGVLLGLLAFFIFDPKTELIKKDPSVKPSLKKYGELFLNKPFILVSFSQAMLTFVIGAFATWMPTFLTRYFDYSLSKAGFVFGAITVAGGIVGTLLGGFFADKLHAKNPKGYFMVIAVSNILALPMAWFGLTLENQTAVLAFLFVAEIFIFMPLGPTTASIVSNTSLNVRSMAFAVNILIIHIFGDAISPTITGHISDITNLRTALLWIIWILIPAAVFAMFAAKAQKREEQI